MVCAHEIAPLLPLPAVGPRARPAARLLLRRTGFLTLSSRAPPSYKSAVKDPAAIKQDIATRARAEGFDVARFTDARSDPHNAARLRQFLEEGHHGTMAWIADRAHWRAEPGSMWPQAKSI